MAEQQEHSGERRAILQQAASNGILWLKRIVDVEQHPNEELAWALTDSPLKV